MAFFDKLSKLKKEFGGENGEYDVRFFPYNWLEDLNDSVKKLERDIRKNHYDSVIFVTHSTGGLLASAFIAKSNANKLLVSKAILIAAPLFGTYASLLPIERGDSRKFDFNEILSNIDWFSHGADAITPKSWVRGWAKNSPTTYQLLPSSEYIRQIPMLNFNSDNWWNPWSNFHDFMLYCFLNSVTNSLYLYDCCGLRHIAAEAKYLIAHSLGIKYFPPILNAFIFLLLHQFTTEVDLYPANTASSSIVIRSAISFISASKNSSNCFVCSGVSVIQQLGAIAFLAPAVPAYHPSLALYFSGHISL